MILRSLLSHRSSDVPLMNINDARRGSLLYDIFTGADSGHIAINERTAMQLSAVWTCVNIRAGLLASLPLKVYQRLDRGRRLAREHRLYKILHDRPSLEDTSYTWRHKLSSSNLLTGNGYGEIAYDNAGRVTAIYPWAKSAVRVEYGNRRGSFHYVVTDASGERVVQPEDMVHLRGFCHDGLEGLSVIQNHMRGLGLAVRTEMFAKNFYDNGARASGVLMYPGKLSQKASDNLLGSFNDKQQGVDNTGNTILLEEGTKYQQLTISPNEAQFLETRQFSRAEIAGIYRVPTMLVPGADSTPPTYASSESFMRYLVDVTLRDDLTLWQQELNAKLFAGTDYYCEFDLRDLLRADAAGRAALYKTYWEIGYKSADDIAADENDNPVPDGDRRYVPMNYVPTDRVDEIIDAQNKAKQAPKPVPGQIEPSSPKGAREIPAGYKLLFADTVKEIKQWESFSEKRAANKLLSILRPIAIDIAGMDGGASLAGYADKLAKRVRSVEDVEVEIARAVEEISDYVQN